MFWMATERNIGNLSASHESNEVKGGSCLRNVVTSPRLTKIIYRDVKLRKKHYIGWKFPRHRLHTSIYGVAVSCCLCWSEFKIQTLYTIIMSVLSVTRRSFIWFGIFGVSYLILRGVAFLRGVLSSVFPRRKAVNIQDIDEALDLLRNSSFRERSLPNKDFGEAYWLHNAFTTQDARFRQEFVRATRQQIVMTPERWAHLAEAATRSTQELLPSNPFSTSKLRSLVQCVTFRLCLHQLYRIDSSISLMSLELVVENINKISVALAKPVLKGEIHPRRRTIDTQLRNIFKSAQIPFPTDAGGSDPLNQLLTAYNATERVALRCFIHIFRGLGASQPYEIAAFRRFLDNPSTDNFNARELMPFSNKDIVNEALRLYPPPTQLYRERDGLTYVIDVQHIHRNPIYWEDPEIFDPRRWRSIRTGADLKPFMPIGVGRISCPTQHGFGHMLIGLIVSALVVEIGAEFQLMGEGSVELFFGGMLDADTKAYSEVYLRRQPGV